MASFSSLAYETIVEIVSLLACPDLASIGRVSHCLHDISQPMLYRAPCLSKTPMPGTGQYTPALAILLQTLLTPGNENLASLVRTLQLDWDDPDVKPASASVFSTESIALITSMASKLDLCYPLKSHSSQFMLLLDLLPHLESLHLTPPNTGSFTRRLRKRLITGRLPLGLQSVREIICPPAPAGTDLSTSTLLQFMQFPRVRSITFPCLAWTTPGIHLDPALESAIATSLVTRLCFSHGSMYPPLLKSFLLVPIALTHFSYTSGPDRYSDLPLFLAALEPLKNSLRLLYLDFAAVGERTMTPFLPLSHTEVPLREFPVLTTLSCSLLPLLRKKHVDQCPRLVDVLPVGLKELQILPDSFWSVSEEVDHLVEMLQCKKSMVPQLERLAWGKTEGAAMLGMACEAAGVELVDESFCWQ